MVVIRVWLSSIAECKIWVSALSSVHISYLLCRAIDLHFHVRFSVFKYQYVQFFVLPSTIYRFIPLSRSITSHDRPMKPKSGAWLICKMSSARSARSNNSSSPQRRPINSNPTGTPRTADSVLGLRPAILCQYTRTQSKPANAHLPGIQIAGLPVKAAKTPFLPHCFFAPSLTGNRL